MIKIIKEGKKPVVIEYIHRATCPYCGCEFEFEDEDLMKERRLNSNFCLHCPTCDRLLKMKPFTKINEIADDKDAVLYTSTPKFTEEEASL